MTIKTKTRCCLLVVVKNVQCTFNIVGIARVASIT